jgi:tetratricopeptide (TPR) repeat protein
VEDIMARKKWRPHGERPRHRHKAFPPDDQLEKLPDLRATEGSMRELLQSLGGGASPDTPLAKAQVVMDRAFAACEESSRCALAHEALDICPDCADAYVVLAEHCKSRKETLRLYQQGVAAGERALGREGFQQAIGHFWGILDTRPYMRARMGLALSLWTAGRREEAAEHLRDMLRLNPNDNQGVRYTLAGFLLALDRDEELAKLIDQYPEGTATWTWTEALLAFRKQGETTESNQLLDFAKRTNKHVPKWLLGRQLPPMEQPDSYSPGSEEEALIYLSNFLAGWKATPGAIAWLRGREGPKPVQPNARGPLSFVKKWISQHLPKLPDVWQADCRQLANWIKPDTGDPVRLWIVLVTSRSNDLVLAHQLVEEEPVSALLWDTLLQAMQNPLAGEPHRPTELLVRSDERWQPLRAHLEEVGITLATSETLDQMERVFADLGDHFGSKPEPGLLDVPGMHADQVAGFFEAAAVYFQQAPWKKLGYEAAIKVECPRFHSPFYAVVMGQSALTFGLAVYEELELLRQMWSTDTGSMTNEENARKTVSLTLIFGEEWDIPVADLDAARRFGWKVARSDAWPHLFHKDLGRSCRRPLVWELELMQGCLLAIPDFVNRHPPDDLASEDTTVTVASGPMKLTLSWVIDAESV